jgi:hypothetical protein
MDTQRRSPRRIHSTRSPPVSQTILDSRGGPLPASLPPTTHTPPRTHSIWYRHTAQSSTK